MERGTDRQKLSRKRTRNDVYEQQTKYMTAKVDKLQNQFKNEAGKIQNYIFKGISIFVNGYTDPTANELKKIMMANGGTYHYYYSKAKTTHIIATHLPNTKITSRSNDFVVSPKWITESVAAGHLLDYKKFLLYTNQTIAKSMSNFLHIDPADNAKSNGSHWLETSPNIFPSENEEIGTEKPLDSINYQLSKLSDKKNFSRNENVGTISADSEKNKVMQKCDLTVALSTANPNFLSEFYSNSRLHHIATAGAMFKQYVKDLQCQEDDFKGIEDLKVWLKEKNLSEDRDFGKVIMHIDMDCFFVSVGLIKYPELKGMPIAVTHAKNDSTVNRNKEDFNYELNCIKDRHKDNDSKVVNIFTADRNVGIEGDLSACTKISSLDLLDGKSSMSEIASCSYEARKKGIKNGMFLGAALKLCPELRTIPYDFDGYKRVSKELYDTVASFSKVIEAVSCDEMFVDLTDVLHSCSVSPLNFATFLRKRIQDKTQCSCSIGLGQNILLARLATHQAKPNGQFHVNSAICQEFMKEQEVANLPGVGGSLSRRLNSCGISTCEDLQAFSLEYLQKNFGSRTGKSLYDFCRGIDERQINKEHQRKSVSAEINYGIRFQNMMDADKFVLELSSEVSKRLTALSMKGKTITLKLKVRAKDAPIETAKFMGHGICDNIAKSITVHSSTSDANVIYKSTMNLLKQMSLRYEDLRGVGIQVSKLMEEKAIGSKSSNSTSILSFLTNKKSNKGRENKSAEEPLKFSNYKNIPPSLSKVSCNKHLGKINESDSESESQPSLLLNVENAANDNDNSSTSNYIDMEVLSALPADLRHQVIEEYESQGYCIPEEFRAKMRVKSLNKNTKTLVITQPDLTELNSSPQAGPSWLCDRLQPYSSKFSNSIHRNESSHTLQKSVLLNSKTAPHDLAFPIVNLSEDVSSCSVEEWNDHVQLNNSEDPLTVNQKHNLITSFSQIDESFLNALPVEVQEDLKKDIEQQKLSYNKSKVMSKNFILKPPQIGNAPGKSKRGRPAKSVKNGSPRKNLKHIAIKKITDFQKKIMPEAVGKNLDDHLITKKRITETDYQSENLDKKTPNLCGEIEVQSVKHLINQWIQSCETPDRFDAEILSTYCKELVIDRDLEKLNLVLRFLFRKTKHSTASWQKCYQHLLDEVQKKMIENYKAKLFIDF